MKQKHTQEPWLRSSDDFVAAESDQLNNGEYILSCFGPDQAANARRIVACVNACRGLFTEDLEQLGLATAFGNQLLAVEQERDQWERRACTDASRAHDLEVLNGELLEALVITLGSLKEICSVRQISRPESTIRRAESAINKITGEIK